MFPADFTHPPYVGELLRSHHFVCVLGMDNTICHDGHKYKSTYTGHGNVHGQKQEHGQLDMAKYPYGARVLITQF
jgi:hypothetical protein